VRSVRKGGVSGRVVANFSSMALLHIIKVRDGDVKHCNWVKDRYSMQDPGTNMVEFNVVAAWLDCFGGGRGAGAEIAQPRHICLWVFLRHAISPSA
jgi:hypothetical protein